ncbi:regulatory protein RecX [Saprospira grandis]|uniref:Regulatory protein RecX n=1 Tax=Saprospira grandis (strain Lewin) TaxID=984262 RepID=H6L3K5_SAPGL|nr:regulatory protein RecX [Saprospira grandis]AFC24953.1 regulatory protein RecX [Saprospira grandis str. Lewin]
MSKPPYISYEAALAKLQSFCAYQERCHQEVRKKLMDLGVYGERLDEIVADLIEDNFLNEERFAHAFAGGKFRVKSWGRLRIQRELKAKNVSAYCIRKALKNELPEEEYFPKLLELLRKKNRLINKGDYYSRSKKLAQYAQYRGYESHLIWEAIKIVLNEEEEE